MRDFGTSESVENAGILDVFPIFHTARLGQKIHCSAADNLFRDSLDNLSKAATAAHRFDSPTEAAVFI